MPLPRGGSQIAGHDAGRNTIAGLVNLTQELQNWRAAVAVRLQRKIRKEGAYGLNLSASLHRGGRRWNACKG